MALPPGVGEPGRLNYHQVELVEVKENLLAMMIPDHHRR